MFQSVVVKSRTPEIGLRGARVPVCVAAGTDLAAPEGEVVHHTHDRADGPSATSAAGVMLLVQPRPRRNATYVIYEDAFDAPEVHIHVRVIEDLRCAALAAMPHDTTGALLGRPCRDDFGIYVVVEHALTAAPDEVAGAPGAVRLPPAGRAAIRRRAAQRHPALEPVGWWFSRPRGAPRYEAGDFAEQALSPSPYHVGIVAAAERFADAGEPVDPLGVHIGPSAALLARRLPAVIPENGGI